MRPLLRQGLCGAASSPAPHPLLFLANGSAKTTASLALARCVSSHRGRGYFLLGCGTRSGVLFGKGPHREFTLGHPLPTAVSSSPLRLLLPRLRELRALGISSCHRGFAGAGLIGKHL